MQKDDNQLISAYLEGDDSALALLVDRHLDAVYRLAFSLTGESAAAEDIAQMSFIKAWKSMRHYRREENFKAWLMVIARNCAIDWLRSRKELLFSSFENAEGENILENYLVDPTFLPDELAIRAEEAERIQRIVNTLDVRYREVLSLRYTSNMTFEEIGKLLKRPLDTVKSQHRRALTLLKRSMESQPI